MVVVVVFCIFLASAVEVFHVLGSEGDGVFAVRELILGVFPSGGEIVHFVCPFFFADMIIIPYHVMLCNLGVLRLIPVPIESLDDIRRDAGPHNIRMVKAHDTDPMHILEDGRSSLKP